ncbi:MAG: WGR domain-containing protein [Burkholderiaceae bacterium]
MTIRLIREDPDNGMHRFYTLLICRDLFDGWNVVREWGRISQPGTVRIDSYDSELAADTAFQKHLKTRFQHGYLITNSLAVAIEEKPQTLADQVAPSSPIWSNRDFPIAAKRSPGVEPRREILRRDVRAN